MLRAALAAEQALRAAGQAAAVAAELAAVQQALAYARAARQGTGQQGLGGLQQAVAGRALPPNVVLLPVPTAPKARGWQADTGAYWATVCRLVPAQPRARRKV